jgi:hypothetical protein
LGSRPALLSDARPIRFVPTKSIPPIQDKFAAHELLVRVPIDRGYRRRTPTPPPFSAMNSIPPISSARRIAKSFAAVKAVC